MGRLGDANDVASAVTYLASSDAAYVTGQIFCVDGGMVLSNHLGRDWTAFGPPADANSPTARIAE